MDHTRWIQFTLQIRKKKAQENVLEENNNNNNKIKNPYKENEISAN